MGKTAIDLTGQRFGRLTVIRRVEDHICFPSGYTTPQWHCKCDCGIEIDIVGKALTKKNGTKSCGCLAKEKTSERFKKYNTYDLSGEYGIGYTSKNEEFYFDLEDYDLIKNYCWCITNSGYVSTYIKGKQFLLHRFIIGKDEEIIDHINHNKVDNRKINLRIVTNSQNGMNSTISKNNTSGFTGVYWHNRDKVWEAWIKVDYKDIYLGRFYNFEDAKEARLKAEDKYYREYSYKNSQKLFNKLTNGGN